MIHRKRLLHEAVVTLALAVLLALLLGGCSDSQLRKASIAARDLALSVRAFQQAEIVAHQQGFIDAEEHGRIQALLIKVAQTGKELDNDIRVLHSKPKATVAVHAFLQSTDTLLNEGVLGVKNEQIRAQLQIAFLSIRTFVGIIGAAIDTGGA